MSCQAAHQLRRLHGAGHIETVSTPFDWLIAPPVALARWLEAGLCDFAVSDIVAERGHAYWPAHGFWLWHGFQDGAKGSRRLAIAETVAREREKLAHQRDNLDRALARGAAFVVTNLQNNLRTDTARESVFARHEADRARFTAVDIDRLAAALSARAGRTVGLHVLTRADRCEPALAERADVTVAAPGTSEWKGEDGVWDRWAARLSA